MNENNESGGAQQPNRKSLPASIVLGPSFGSMVGLVFGMLYGNIVWGLIIGLSLGIILGLLWPSLKIGKKPS